MDARTAAAVMIERQACADLAKNHVPGKMKFSRGVFCLQHLNHDQYCEDVIAAAILAQPPPT